MRKRVRIYWDAGTSVTGARLALVIFSDRSYEYIPHTEF